MLQVISYIERIRIMRKCISLSIIFLYTSHVNSNARSSPDTEETYIYCNTQTFNTYVISACTVQYICTYIYSIRSSFIICTSI